MTRSALPPRLNDPDNWKGTDDDTWYMRWRIQLKYLYAFGPRASEWWAKWREFPKTLLAIRSKHGLFRVETEGWERDTSKDCLYAERVIANENVLHYEATTPFSGIFTPGYLSRIQYYTRWHIQIQWPFLFGFHFYFKASDVPKYGADKKSLDNKLFFCYFGAHRDGDKVYWFPSGFVGLTWK